MWIMALWLACVTTPAPKERCADALERTHAALYADYAAYREAHPDKEDRAQLQALYAREQALFDAARACDFGDDRTMYSRWHRSRLKFPSDIQQAWWALDGGP